MLFAFFSNKQRSLFLVSLGIKSNLMDNYKKQAELHIELAKKLMAQKRTKAEILADFVGAGIMNVNGEFTEPYKELRKLKRIQV
ncbi:MAG: hypothetical protein RIS42_1301 [Bacteroidota bacterium]